MEIVKAQSRKLSIKFLVLGLIFVLYSLALVQGLFQIQFVLSFIYLAIAGICIINNIKKLGVEDKKVYVYIMVIILNWLFYHGIRFFAKDGGVIFKFGPNAVIHLFFSFVIAVHIFMRYAKELNKLQLIVDSILIQSVVVAIGVSVDYFNNFYPNLSLAEGIGLYTYHFLGLMLMVFVMVIFTSFRQKRLSKHNILILSGLLSCAILRVVYQYGIYSGRPAYLMLGQIFYFLPITFFLLASEKIEFRQNPLVFEQGDAAGKGVKSFSKKYLSILFGALTLVLYTRGLIGNILMLIVFFVLLIFHFTNTALENEFQAEKRLWDEEKKRRQLEDEVSKRTQELKKKNKELKEKNDLLADLIYFDMNVKLYTIRYLQECLSSWNQDHALTLMAVDIKDFKNINSFFSYAIGDKVLKKIAEGLKTAYSEQAVLFRLNSNKFGLLFFEALAEDQIGRIARDIHIMGRQPIIIDDVKINLKFSIGVASYEKEASDIQKILENAEYAERQAYEMIEEYAYQVFNREMKEKLERENQIRRLLDYIDFDQEFELHYQPQCDIAGNLLGMEALLRWTNPKLGTIPPGEFIPIAEQSTVILRIAQWTLGKGIEQIKEWNMKYKTNYRVGINISTKFIENSSFLNYVRQVMTEYDIPARWLDLEITETSLINMNKGIIRLFEELAQLGVSISIDDFGTGYSSLSYINSFQISNIKLARELVESIVSNPKEIALVKAIIMMANSLDLDIIAEGVEEKNQLQTLAGLGCEKIQGYYFGRPQNAIDFERNFICKNQSMAV